MIGGVDGAELRFVSLYSGCGGLDLGFARAGMRPVWANDAANWAVETYNRIPKVTDPRWREAAQRFEGHAAIAGDVLTAARDLGPGLADLVIGGPPCFPAETLVLTARGHVPIEEVRTGDLVLTHRGRWRRVLATGSKIADTIMVRGQGATVETTAEHPFWSRPISRSWNNSKRSYEQVWADPEWIAAADLAHKGWAIPSACEPLAVPEIPGWQHTMGADFWWLVGRWLGDGQAIHGNALADWLTGNFGAGPAAKHLPGWAFGMAAEHRAALLAGYVSADGHARTTAGELGAATTSKALAVGLINLVTSLGYTPTLACLPRPAAHVVEGRRVTQRPWWQVRWRDVKTNQVRRTDGHLWTQVREVRPGRSNVPVYNLEVEEDNTFTADGIVVHNCQGFSVAGRMDPYDPRSRHVFNFLDVVGRVRPRAFLMENVAALARNRRWSQVIGQLAATAAADYDTRLIVLNACHWGVPQARIRMFLVGLPKGAAGLELLSAPTANPPPTVGDVLRELPPLGQPGNTQLCTAKITMAKIPVLRVSPFAGMLFNGQGRPIDLNRPAPTLPATMGGNRTPIIDLDQLERNATPWVVSYHHRLIAEREPPLAQLPPQARLRRLTVEEAAAIQTFPADMQWCGPQTARFRQIGNAVPPVLAWHVARAVRIALNGSAG
jgi:DNA (cytosine-5)-methyltransferase 1